MKRLTRFDSFNNARNYDEHFDDDLWCKSSDVEQLEAINAELLEALEKIVARFELACSPVTKGEFDGMYHVPISMASIARSAIAKEKGEQP